MASAIAKEVAVYREVDAIFERSGILRVASKMEVRAPEPDPVPCGRPSQTRPIPQRPTLPGPPRPRADDGENTPTRPRASRASSLRRTSAFATSSRARPCPSRCRSRKLERRAPRPSVPPVAPPSAARSARGWPRPLRAPKSRRQHLSPPRGRRRARAARRAPLSRVGRMDRNRSSAGARAGNTLKYSI